MVARIVVAVGLLSLTACASSNGLNILAAALGGAASAAPVSTPQEGLFYQRSFVSGQSRVCVYHGVTGDTYVNIGMTDLCPLAR
jgi:hypothetical protein